MQYDVTTPQQYFDGLEDDWRKSKLEEIRTMILRANSEIREGIEYKMLCYGSHKKSLFHLNAQKGYVSLYVGNIDKVDAARNYLDGLDMGKGCIRIKKNTDISDTNLERFILEVIRVWKEGGETDC